MDLAKIQHLRCGSYEDRATYVWVPTDMTEQELDALIEKARQDCLDAERTVDGETAPLQFSWWDFMARADQHKTLVEVRGEYAEHERVYREWKAKRDAARKSFAQRLKDVSNGRVSLFHEEEFAFSAECNWGHNHGVKVDYGETEIA